jgi:pyruvate kinase
MRTVADAVARAARLARDEGFAAHGDPVVVAAGIPFGQPGTTTNSLRVAQVK